VKNYLKSIDKETKTQFVHYVMVGGSAFAVEFLLYALCNELLGLKYYISNAIVYTLKFWMIFLLNRLFTFKSKGIFWRQAARYLALFCFNLALTSLLIYAFTDCLLVDKYISKLLVSCCVVLWNFPLYKHFIYR